MRIGHGNECIGDRRQASIESPHPIRPASRMKGRSNDRHPRKLRCQTTPKHFVSGTNCDHSVRLATSQQVNQSWQDSDVPLVAKQVGMDGEFTLNLSCQRSGFLQARQLRTNHTAIHPPHQVHQQRFGATHRHAGDHEHAAQWPTWLSYRDSAPWVEWDQRHDSFAWALPLGRSGTNR